MRKKDKVLWQNAATEYDWVTLCFNISPFYTEKKLTSIFFRLRFNTSVE